MVDVFVDESGINRGSGFSVFCLITCNTDFSQELNESVTRIEESLGIEPFHWRLHHWKIKVAFLQQVLKIDNWRGVAVVVNNTDFNYLRLEKILKEALLGLDVNRLYIDGKKTKNYTNTFKKSLKDAGLNLSKLKLVTSHSAAGLRLADAVAGLFRLKFDGKANSGEMAGLFDRFLKKKITTQLMSGFSLPTPPFRR